MSKTFQAISVLGLLLCFTPSAALAKTSRPQYEAASGYHLQHVAELPTDKARSVAFSGHYAWVARNLVGMDLVDIKNPRKPKRVRRFAPEEIQPLHVKVIDDDLLLIAERFQGLVLWDVSDVDKPTSLGSVLLPGIATHVDVTTIDGKRIAAVACGGEGMAAVDISKPTSPTLLGMYKLRADYSRRVALDGSIAYLADHFDGGLKVIDLKSPNTPEPFYQVRLRGFCESVARRGNLLAVGYRNYGVRLFNIESGRSTSAKPRSTQTTPTLTYLCNIARARSEVRDVLPLANNLLVLANDITGVELYDISTRETPVLLDEYQFDNPETSAQSIQERDGYLYVPSWDGGLQVLEIAYGKPKPRT